MSETMIIIPCFNEQTNVKNVVEEIFRCQPSAEIVVVNDGSTDHTSLEARNSGHATVLDLPVNLGVGGAVQTGFKFALQRGASFAVKVDGDGQHPASAIEKLLHPLLCGEADMVIGTRFLDHNAGYQSSFSRRIGIKLIQLLSYLLTNSRVTDPTSGFRAYNHRAIEFMSEHYPTFDYPEPEEIVLAARNGLRILEVPVEMRNRQSGTSTISSTISIYYMFKVTLAMIFIFLRPVEKGLK